MSTRTDNGWDQTMAELDAAEKAAEETWRRRQEQGEPAGGNQ